MSTRRKSLCTIGIVCGLITGTAPSARGDCSVVRCASTFPGADAGAKINAAIANLPVTGGTVIADFEGSQTATSTIAVPANIWLQLGAMTLTSSANPVIKVTGGGGQRISGSVASANAQTAATTINNTGTGDTIAMDNSGLNLRGFRLENFNLIGNQRAGRGIFLNNAGNGVIDKVEIFQHKGDGIQISSGIDTTIRNTRITGFTGIPTTVFGVNCTATPTSTAITLERLYISNYDTGLRNSGCVNLLTVGNIYETVRIGVWNSQNGFLAVGDYFEGNSPFAHSYVLDRNGIATIVGPWPIVSSSIDHTGVADKTRLNFVIPIDGAVLGRLNVLNGVTPDSGGVKHQRLRTGSITAGARADVTVTWRTAFADANYTPNCTVLDSSAVGAGLSVERIRSQAASSIVVQVLNSAARGLTGTLNCWGVHD